MAKRKRTRATVAPKAIEWLPIDSRLLPAIFSFSHVTGVAKLFIITEMMMASVAVFGTLVLVLLNLL